MNAAPHALRRSRLDAPPAAAWPHVAHGRFIAAYLGAELPCAAAAGTLAAGHRLHGLDRDGRVLAVHVLAAEPPTSLSLMLQVSGGGETLHFCLAACAGGSQLTVLHEPLGADTAAPPADDVATLLAEPLPALLRGAAPADAAALAAAQRYLAGTAQAMQALRRQLPARAGHAKPAPDRFSLAEHIWHLADVETLGWAVRLPRVLHETEPHLAGVDGDRLAIERRYNERPWRAAAQRFISQRRHALQALQRFDAGTLQRPVHFGGSRIRAGELLAAMLAHDHEHRLEMAALWPPAPAP